jgi:hypothetical protein
VLVETGGIQFQQACAEQALVALPTVGGAGEVGAAHAVGRVAMGANDVQGFVGHGSAGW